MLPAEAQPDVTCSLWEVNVGARQTIPRYSDIGPVPSEDMDQAEHEAYCSPQATARRRRCENTWACSYYYNVRWSGRIEPA